jgi:uncharacterized protein (DUF58 family)
MLTRQGWTVGWGAMALFGGGRLLGIGQLYVFGAAALLLVIGALAYVHLVRVDLEVDRRVHPARVYAGTTSRVRIGIRNLRRRRTPLLRIEDPVSDTNGAHMVLAPLDPGAAETCTYRLPTERRGIVHVGPLRIVIADPFGLAQGALMAAPRVQATVFPRVDPVQPVPFTAGHDPLAGVRQPNALGRSGDDFYALRPYAMGDDLRRIHWPSTARHDELLVRQHEQPWQGRTTVLLDLDNATHDPDGFETAVSAAASIVSANSQRRDLVRLVMSDGTDTGFGVGRTHLEALLEWLAVVETIPASDVSAMLESLQRGPGSGGSLVAIAGRLTEESATALRRTSHRFGSLTVVLVEPSGSQPVPFPAAMPIEASLPAVRVGAERPFKAAWNQALRARGGARSAIAGRAR